MHIQNTVASFEALLARRALLLRTLKVPKRGTEGAVSPKTGVWSPPFVVSANCVCVAQHGGLATPAGTTGAPTGFGCTLSGLFRHGVGLQVLPRV